MIAEIGHALLWLAAACALLQAVAGLVPAAGLDRLAVPAALAQGWLWLWITGCVATMLVDGDLSVTTVAAAIHPHMPTRDRFSAALLGEGGRAVTLTAMLAWAGAVSALGRPRTMMLGVCGIVGVAMSGWLLIGIAPFARLVPVPTEGGGATVANALAAHIILGTLACVALGMAILMAVTATRDWRKRLEAARGWAALALAASALGMLTSPPTIFDAVVLVLAAIIALTVGQQSRVATWARRVAALGLALAAAGGGASLSSSSAHIASLRLGEQTRFGDFQLKFIDAEPLAGPDWSGVRATIEVGRDGRRVAIVHPERHSGPGALDTADDARIGLGIVTLGFTGIKVPDRLSGLSLTTVRSEWAPFAVLLNVGLLLVAAGAGLVAAVSLRR